MMDERESMDFFMKYMTFAEKMRPDLAAIQDEEKRYDEISKWLAEMDEPDHVKFMSDFVSRNPLGVHGKTNDYVKKSKEVGSRVSEIKDLPMEDTVWSIEDFCSIPAECTDEGLSRRYLRVMDRRDKWIGFNEAIDSDVSLKKQAFDLVCTCALYPMIGQLRKPKYVTFKDPQMAEQADGIDFTGLGIRYMFAGVQSSEQGDQYVRMRECSVCRLRGSKELFKKCSSCQAIQYCSQRCQKKDWKRSGSKPQHSHKIWCGRFKQYMSKADTLKQLPFTFAQETTSEEFELPVYRQFLEKHGVFNEGLWRREFPALMRTGQFVQFGDLLETDNPIVLPVESSILDEAPPEMTMSVRDWEGYYCYRGFRLDSPIAILLQFPLTLYHILKFCLPNDFTQWWEMVDAGEIRIDIVGAEKEVEMVSLFEETGRLFPDTMLDIYMYGNEISSKVDGKSYQFGNVKVTLVRRLYHKKTEEYRVPHVVVGFNAGLAAYQTWTQTLVKLRTERIPAYFTDYCQYSCECSRMAMEALGLGTTSEPVINPYRSPVRKLAEENDMPWYSNGFLFHLKYP